MSIETFCSQIDEYRNMDKKTVIKMLLASQEENKKLHEKLDARGTGQWHQLKLRV